MKIAIDISPLQSGHKVRGVGFYLEYLKKALVTYLPENQYNFFITSRALPKDMDLIHYPYFDPFFLTLPFKKQYKTVVTVHDLTPLVFPKHFPTGLKGAIKWQIQKFHLRGVDAIITDSHASKRDVVSIAGIPENKVFVIHLAAGEAFRKLNTHELKREDIRKKYRLPEKFALYVGDVTWNKNLPRLMQSAIATDIPLVMVGKALLSEDFDTTNPWNSDLVKVQKLAETSSNIIRLGFVPTEDLVQLYNLASVFIFPSLYEGFGLPVIEAMQAGCPVITTKEGSLEEVAGNAAIYVDAYDASSIEKALNQVFHSEKLQKEFSEKGLEQAKNFTWRKTAELTAETYNEVINK